MSFNDSDQTLLETTNITMQEAEENTIVNSSKDLDDTDPTLTSADFSMITNSTENDDVSENSLHANMNLDAHETVDDYDDALSKSASSIVDEAIDSASLSLRSSGDFSILNDVDSLKAKSEIVKHHESSEDILEKKPVNGETDQNLPKKQDEWLDILGNGLLKKKVLEAGQGETSRPQRGQEVTVEIASFAEDDSTLELTKTMTFIIADFDVAEGIDMAVNLMEKGEKCILECDAKYCQPKDGQSSSIPKEGKVIFHVKLLEIEDGPYNISVPIEKRLLWVDAKRKLGNFLYSKNMLEEAKSAYTKCNRVLRQASNQEQSEENQSKIKDLTVKCYNNLAAVLIKLHNWKDALQACLTAEKMDGNNIKTLYRKGTICSKLGQYKQSIIALKKAVSLSPDDKTLQKELSKQQRRLEEQNEAQKSMYKRMFGNPKDKEGKPEINKKSWFSSRVLVGSSLFALGTAILVGVYMMHR